MDNNSFICDTFLQPLPHFGRGFFLLCSDYSNKLLKSHNMKAYSLAHLNVQAIDLIKGMGNEKKNNEDNYLEYLSFVKAKQIFNSLYGVCSSQYLWYYCLSRINNDAVTFDCGL